MRDETWTRRSPGCRSSTGKPKVRYATEGDARAALVGAVMRANKHGGKPPVRWYYCQRCDGWHLTALPKPPQPI